MRIDNSDLREAFVHCGRSAYAVAIDLGWHPAPGRSGGDSSRLLRALGLRPVVGPRGTRHVCRMIDADIAVRIAEAIGLDPRDVGA
jgi:hypothetical protein